VSEPNLNEANSQKLAAGVCAIILGTLGIHKFVLGYTNEGITMLLVSLVVGTCTCGLGTMIMWAFGIAEGIIYLTKTDEDFYNTYIANRKGWF
jgi:TM2 domain-containing membrane protein YozV